MKLSDPLTGFRLPKTMLATVDLFCAKQDLTRSQLFRRSIVEYLKNQNAIVTEVNPTEPQHRGPLSFSNDSGDGRRMYKEKTWKKSYDTKAAVEGFETVFSGALSQLGETASHWGRRDRG